MDRGGPPSTWLSSSPRSARRSSRGVLRACPARSRADVAGNASALVIESDEARAAFDVRQAFHPKIVAYSQGSTRSRPASGAIWASIAFWLHLARAIIRAAFLTTSPAPQADPDLPLPSGRRAVCDPLPGVHARASRRVPRRPLAGVPISRVRLVLAAWTDSRRACPPPSFRVSYFFGLTPTTRQGGVFHTLWAVDNVLRNSGPDQGTDGSVLSHAPTPTFVPIPWGTFRKPG